MDKILRIIKDKKIYFISFTVIFLFIIARIVLLQKPNTEITYTVKQENLVDSVQVSGTYTTAAQIQVNAPTNGVVTELYVNNNDVVTKGDALFHVDSTATEDQQTKAYANYESALSALQTAQNTKQSLDATMWAKQQAYLNAQNTQDYKTNHTQNPATKNDYTDLEKLQIDNAVVQTQKDFAAAEQAFTTADVAVNAASAQMAAAELAYQETQSTTVTAPASGKIVNLMVKTNDQVLAPQLPAAASQDSTTTQTTSPVLVIANLENPGISAHISEDYATRIVSGQKAYIQFDALKEKSFPGKVETIATVGNMARGVVSYDARISADTLPSSIKPNMTALITIETLRKNNIITIPTSAIVAQKAKQYVIEAKTHRYMPIIVGIKGLAKAEVTEGLAAGTVIVANPSLNE